MIITEDAAIVTVRNSSSRLPNKAIMKIKNSLRSIDIVIERKVPVGRPRKGHGGAEKDMRIALTK